jgi:hypothetical protein
MSIQSLFPLMVNIKLNNRVIMSIGTRFISGVAHHYKDKFPKELEPYIEFDDYQRVISDINDILRMFWPCFAAMCIGYFFCPITLGLSLLIPKYNIDMSVVK